MSKPAKAWRVPALRSTERPTSDLKHLAEWFERQPHARDRFRWVLRDSLDELLDGRRTGRWCYQHLSKTEKTYLGTAVEVNLTKEFEIPNGQHLDWQVSGTDIDCKFSKDLGGWEIPMEMYLCEAHGDRSGDADHPALLVWMSDDESEWAAGLIRVTDQILRTRLDTDTGQIVRAYNRDNKRRLAEAAAGRIYWMWGGIQRDLPTNRLLHLPTTTRDRILSDRSGQKRVNELFRELQGELLGRHTVLTVGQQEDAPKRARDARIALRNDGIAILGHEKSHRAIAKGLGLPEPVKGEWVSVHLTRVDVNFPGLKIELDGDLWAEALGEVSIEQIPKLPRSASDPS